MSKVFIVFHPKNLSVIKSLYFALSLIRVSLNLLVLIARGLPVIRTMTNKNVIPIIVGIKAVRLRLLLIDLLKPL